MLRLNTCIAGCFVLLMFVRYGTAKDAMSAAWQEAAGVGILALMAGWLGALLSVIRLATVKKLRINGDIILWIAEGLYLFVVFACAFRYVFPG